MILKLIDWSIYATSGPTHLVLIWEYPERIKQ
jgi:hypothetical protein